MDVVVIGAGILGASCARSLARSGCRVTVIDSNAEEAKGATGRTWAWLNSNAKKPQHYKDLNVKGMSDWKEFPELAHFPGCLALADIRGYDASYPSVALTPQELLLQEKALAQSAGSKGARLYSQEGFALAAEATAAFLTEAEAHGARTLFSHRVIRLEASDRQVTGVVTDQGSIAADVVVLAAGTSIQKLSESAGIHIPLTSRPPTLTALTHPLPPTLRHMIITDDIFLLQRPDGAVLFSVPEGDDSDLINAPVEAILAKAEALLKQAAKVVPALQSAAVASAGLGYRPIPLDGHPIVGFCIGLDNLYVMVTHSGATLGPLCWEGWQRKRS